MAGRKVLIACLLSLVVACGVVLTVLDPSFWVQQGMTYDEGEAVLGKQEHGMRPQSIDDGSWTGLWLVRGKMVEVTFDDRNTVRESPNIVRRILDRTGL